MRGFRDLSIRVKLTLILLVVVGLAMLFTGFMLTLHDISTVKEDMVRRLASLAELVGDNSRAALTFGDRNGAAESLTPLRKDPALVFACLYDDKGQVFATYPQQDAVEWTPPTARADSHGFTSDGHLELFKRFTQAGVSGTVYLYASMAPAYAPVRERVLVRVIVTLVAVALAVLVAALLQRTVSQPILQLARVTQNVSRTADYSLRVQKRGDDELGVLCDGLNDMLTQIQKRDAQLERHRHELEVLVQERTWVLEAKTQELARSNAELELFASVASHDLQEPLRMVSSYVELLAQRYKDQIDEKAQRWINFAVEGAARMKQLINDLLEFSRIGTRGKPFEPTDCQVAFDQVLTNLQRAIADKGAQVTAGPLPTVVGDATQLSQLLQNLIGNAIKFCSATQPAVRVEAVREDGAWRFSVHDNGIGIDPQFAERIFIIFQRLHTREQYSGTGIGLAVCKKIVERHGGRIWVESELGHGATFYFTIPDPKEMPHGHE